MRHIDTGYQVCATEEWVFVPVCVCDFSWSMNPTCTKVVICQETFSFIMTKINMVSNFNSRQNPVIPHFLPQTTNDSEWVCASWYVQHFLYSSSSLEGWQYSKCLCFWRAWNVFLALLTKRRWQHEKRTEVTLWGMKTKWEWEWWEIVLLWLMYGVSFSSDVTPVLLPLAFHLTQKTLTLKRLEYLYDQVYAEEYTRHDC